ncbi:MAG: peptidylprolyl isomerase [Halocynthiibacter sp.]
MLKPITLGIGAALVLALAAPVAAQETTADTVVATVNGSEITLGHMIITRGQLPQQYQGLPNSVLFDGILEQLIQQSVLAQSLGDELPADARLMIDNETRAILAGRALDQVIAAALTDEAVQAAYTARYEGAEPVTEYNASHILVETEEAAIEIRQQLTDGADFAELAREKSTGPSGPNGGNLGWFSAGMMVKPFEDAVVTLEVGQVSDPVETQFGWHVITLLETRLQDAPAIEDVREELLAEIQRVTVEETITGLTADAEVTRVEDGVIDPEMLSDMTLIAP